MLWQAPLAVRDVIPCLLNHFWVEGFTAISFLVCHQIVEFEPRHVNQKALLYKYARAAVPNLNTAVL